MLIDPNTWSKDGTIALGEMGFSDDGKYLAYSRSEAGSDWSVWHVLEIATGQQLPDELKWTKFSNASWTKDGKGFFYSRYEEPKPGAEFQSLNFNHKLFYHRLGTPQEADVLVYYRPEHPDWQYDGEVSEDGRYLVISIVVGTDARQRIVVRDLTEPYAMPHRTDRQFRARVHLPRQRRAAAVLQDRRRRPAPPRDRHRPPQAEAEGLAGDHPAGGKHADRRQPGRRPLHRLVSQGRLDRGQALLAGRQVRRGRAVAGHRHGGRLHGQAADGKRTETETFYSFSSFATPPSIYRSTWPPARAA